MKSHSELGLYRLSCPLCSAHLNLPNIVPLSVRQLVDGQLLAGSLKEVEFLLNFCVVWSVEIIFSNTTVCVKKAFILHSN